MDVLLESEFAAHAKRLEAEHRYVSCFAEFETSECWDCVDPADISGFYFYGDGKSYAPPEDIVHFLKSGAAPIYIG